MRRGIVGYGFALLLAACTNSQGEPGPAASDSETHFLTLCVGRCADGLTCICGACTQPCVGASACREFGASASCEAPHAADRYSCGAIVPAAVCEAECDADTDCAAVGPMHRCEQGVCRAAALASASCPASAAPECAPGEHLRAQTDGDGCTSAICEADFACRGPVERNGGCDAAWFGYSFVPERGRCEGVMIGGCEAPTGSNYFETAEACWASCEADNLRVDCLEAWEPFPRYESPIVFGVHVLSLVERMEGTHRAALRFADGSSSPLEVTLSEVIAYLVHATDNTNPNRSSVGIPIQCRETLQVEAAVELATADGRFAERWPRVAFEVEPGERARARVSLKRADWPVNDQENVTLQGSYDPGSELNPCDMPLHLSFEIGPDTFSGAMGFLLTTANCDGVVQPAAGPGAASAATWLAIDAAGNACEDSACCTLLSTGECGLAAQCELLFGALYDEGRECKEPRAAGCAARERICGDAVTSARDRANQCWLFSDTCLPGSFTDMFVDEDRCGSLLSEAPTCE